MAYFPASNLTSGTGLTHMAQVFYDRIALSSLRKKFMFWKGVETRTLPKKNGKTIQFYRVQELGANTTPANEGDVASGISLSSTTLQATVAQYCDFMSFSDMLVDTAIDGDIVAVGADKLGYRAGLTFDTINRNEVDSNATSVDVPLLSDYLTGMDVAGIATRFDGLDIQPMQNGFYQVLMHPYIRYDFIHDPQVGGFIDVEKRGAGENQDALYDVAGGNGGFVARWGGCEIWASTNLTVVSGSPNKYRTYFFGAEALGAIDLAGRGPTRSEDQNKQKFSIHVENNIGPTVATPEGKIRAFCSYNCVYVAKTLDSNPFRYRKIDAPTSLGL
jgi:N4-gp56 family major capsid protein